METQDAISRIIFLIGGKENINNVWHCMTRLPGVLGAQLQSDQFQIIIGPKVSSWYERLLAVLGPVGEEAAEKPHQRKGLVSLFMDTVSGVFGPIVPAIAGAGMIKGLLAGLIALKAVPQNSDTVMIIDLIASGVFYFLPFFLAVSAAKIFKTNEYLAVAVAACLMYPTLIDAAKALAAHHDGAVSALWLLNAVPIPVFNYASSVIPVIFSVLALKYIYAWVDRIMPEVLKTVFTPTLALFIGALAALVIIGPVGIWLGKALAWFIEGLFGISASFAGLVVGAMSAAISALLGITEPALFGVLTRYKKAFVAATVASSLASAFIAFFGVRLYGYILSSIFSLPAYIGPYFIFALSGVAIAIVLSFTLTTLLVRQER